MNTGSAEDGDPPRRSRGGTEEDPKHTASCRQKRGWGTAHPAIFLSRYSSDTPEGWDRKMGLREAYFRHFERKYCEIIRKDFMEEVELGRD